ncbi:MAG: hypothetical protein HN995_03790 [Candidatus Marinimicrobia bacterium]|jgi:alpha-L-fucosidase|nr:hypothetical protein [Candidatus Neomarinimicrobiota bacterium]MBT3823587.1 hypothetical protein [Candidatus Neomarinimicrobiota bacterium]MBT4129554.1 hypothetical protein [Candidatus Neomarinimicrobiota bacterium]MBT4295920.1 hypothetical protein [Candidatus Neomarinimicrobiota bacterium]MBT4420078.1 hypothetical protein [Candidatus Neomarinimicrobiota bacterium]
MKLNQKHTNLVITIVTCSLLILTSLSAGEVAKNASPERMEEWRDWKFGMFIHWGPFAQAGAPNGRISSMRKDLEQGLNYYKTFNPVKYDPNQWAELASDAGMRYAVLVAKHHDGFCNWDSKVSERTITNPDCPWSKSKNPDIVGEYVKAFRKADVKVGLYSSHLNYSDPGGMGAMIDAKPGAKRKSVNRWVEDYKEKAPELWKNYVQQEYDQLSELMGNYGPIDIVWFDIHWPKNGSEDAAPIYQMIREKQPNIIFDNRGTLDYVDYKVQEQWVPNVPPKTEFWEFNCPTASSGGGGFWYKGENAVYRTGEELLYILVDVVGKGGNFLLNVSPKPDGSIADQEVAALMDIGKWMDNNSEAIYGTTASPWGDPPAWGRISTKGNRLYLMVWDWKEGSELALDIPAKQVKRVSLLANNKKVKYSNTKDGIKINLSTSAPDKYVSVIAVDYSGDLKVKQKWSKPVKHEKSDVWHFDKNTGKQEKGFPPKP